jgi:hypothetical protein
MIVFYKINSFDAIFAMNSILICLWSVQNHMAILTLPSHLEDKIFEIKFGADETVSKIISYFPLSELETQKIRSNLQNESFDGFHSIFTDKITEDEWNNTKEQIKKKFKDELFDIDKKS